MRDAKWTRRKLLSSLIGGTALLPFLPVLEGDAEAQGVPGGPPKRLIIWFYPNGTLPAAYFPTTEGANFELTRILEPLAPHKNDLIVTKGIRLNAYDGGVKIVHISCVAPLLTGFSIPDGEQNEAGTTYGWAAGPSVDQVVAAAIGAQTRFPSLEFHNVGFQDRLRTQFRVIYKARNQPLSGMIDPKQAFQRLFENAVSGGISRLSAERLAVLGHVKQRLDRLNQRIGAADRLKVEAHLEAVRSLEKRFGASAGGCSPKPLNFAANVTPGNCGDNNSNTSQACENDKFYGEIGKAHMDLIVQAFTCDQTRVASLQWGAGGRGSHFQFFPDGENEHLASHKGTSDPIMNPTNGVYVRMKRWYMEQLAYLIQELKRVPEGNGSLFDSTLIVACSEHGVGSSHSPDNIPFLLAGGGWYFKTGRYLTYQRRSNNDLLLSICHAMGLEHLTTFGDPQYCAGPLPGLT
jgi:hypothetical protein